MSELSRLPLSEYRTKFGLEAFVETGCYMGDGIQTALDVGFSSVNSCDVSESHLAHCRQRFASDPRVTLYEGDSLSFIASLSLVERRPTLFWLDAHFPGFYGFDELERKVGRFPLLDELRQLARLPGIERDVILADDLRVVADDANPRWRPGEQGDYFIIRDVRFEDLLQPMAATHEVVLHLQEEGILAFAPARGTPA
jgi:hypothetical protein